MADKRISQLIERVDIANDDVLPIVASGATTTNKVTVSTLQDWMQDNLDVGVTSVGLSMPSAFVVSASPVTSSGNISVIGAGTVSQYIRGDGSLADFPQGGGGGGASVNYYLNGSVSQGTIGGIAYKEINKTPILGAGTDFVAIADGYLASFITDAGDPGLLEIPGGNWNFETYFSASSGGGTPSFYVELYKVNSGGTATLIASNSGTPELIAFGTTITPYFSTLAVPTTALAITDRLALRYYVSRSGRTITLHTENSHLCQIITTFTTGLTALNGLTAQVQNFATGTSGTDFGISSTSATHTFNLPTASATNRGLLSSADWTTFNNKAPSVAGGYVPYSGAAASVNLGAYSITANAINSAGSGSTAGQINLRSDAFFSLVNGYGSIASGTTNQFNFYQTTGAGVFRGAILSLNSITASATRTYTLPDASGTLALSTDLSSYLPLSGGTLTGALNGTSASFTGSITSTANEGLIIAPSSGASYINYKIGATSYSLIGVAGAANDFITGSALGDLNIRATNNQKILFSNNNGSSPSLTLASTGAATFSSSVTATDTIQSSSFFRSNTATTNSITIGVSANANYGYIGNSNFWGIRTGTAGDFNIDVNNSSSPINALKITQGGNLGINTTPTNSDGKLEIAGSNGNLGGGTAKRSATIFSTSAENADRPGIILGYDTAGGGVIAAATQSSGQPLNFWTYNGSSWGERMRITSGGFLKASNTGSYVNVNSSIHEFNSNQADNNVIFNNTSANPYGPWFRFSSTANNSNNYFWTAEDTVAVRGKLLSNGGFQNFQANDVNLSDERTKKDISPLESYWDKFKALEIVKFKYKDQTHDDFNIGVIAQQVEQVAPEFVDVDGWNTRPKLDEEGNEIVSEEEPLKSIYTADLHHATIKVLQEAMAKIEKLETEIDSLKNQIK